MTAQLFNVPGLIRLNVHLNVHFKSRQQVTGNSTQQRNSVIMDTLGQEKSPYYPGVFPERVYVGVNVIVQINTTVRMGSVQLELAPSNISQF